MKPYFEEGGIVIYHGDCREVLPGLGSDSFDACLTDPPYHLTSSNKQARTGFMGKTWDGGDVAFRPETWDEISRVLKPGAHVASFGGTRTYHRLACAIEDAGFEIRDCLMWLYGSGFPKSLDISQAIDKQSGLIRQRFVHPRAGTAGNSHTFASDKWTKENHHTRSDKTALTAEAKQFDGYGTALKPAYEPIVLGMKPLDGTFAENALKWGVAGVNVDGSRIGDFVNTTPDGFDRYNKRLNEQGYRPDTYQRGRDGEASANRRYTKEGSTNFAATPGPRGGDSTGRWPANVLLDEEAARLLDEQSGELGRSAGGRIHSGTTGKSGIYGTDKRITKGDPGFGDSGGASRFFYTAKADKSDRGEGNTHPTVKPLDLMRYLAKLLAPPSGGRFLEPFAGSGSTLVACKALGIQAVGIELEESHCEIIARRLRQSVLDLQELPA